MLGEGQHDAVVAGLDVHPQQLAAPNQHPFTVSKGGVGIRVLSESMRNATIRCSPNRVSARGVRGRVGAQASLYPRACTECGREFVRWAL